MSKLDQFRREAAELDRQARAKWQALMMQDGENLDDDGYPTELACDRIRAWHWSDKQGWLKFVEGLWYLADWGWSEADEPNDLDPCKIVHRYHISTAGWSGNETLIRAMQANSMLWHSVWVQSRRGGHYILEIDVPQAAQQQSAA